MLKSAFLGFLVALGCLLPPIVHFLSGPLGPLIGGWFAGTRAKASRGQALLIGLLMGMFMVAPMGALLALSPLLEDWLPGGLTGILSIAAVVVVAYTTLMGGFGAWLGGSMAKK